ncbi:MAG: glycosyltransferase [Phycisphaerae bacterium]|nr:glycosyltransferase [Phycisphaerae bacterium]
MRVVQFSTYADAGGAARAARRLHVGLRGIGVDSRMLALERGGSGDDSTAAVYPDPREAATWSAIERQCIVQNRSDVSNTWFSTGRPGCDVADHPWVVEADVLHLHWVPGLLASRDVGRLLARGKRLVWTLHDEWPFTGGCHFTAGCERWRTRCHACPQLRSDPHRIVEAIFDDKLAECAGGTLTLAAPSRWLAERAAQSAIFGGRRSVCIEHGLDLATWSPVGRDERRRELGLAPDDSLILFTAGDVAERRKGFHVLLDALTGLQPAVAGAKLHVAVLGWCPPEAIAAARERLPMPLIACGSIADDARAAATYAAADLFVIPSLEDNLPNTIVESLACGTPVVGSAAGGIPEALARQSFDACAPVGDAAALASRIESALAMRDRRDALRVASRAIAERHYALERHAREYLALYHDLVGAAMR